MSRVCSILTALIGAVATPAFAHQSGIGDPTFPTLGSRSYGAEHYAIQVNYDPVSNSLSGICTISGHMLVDGSEIVLDFKGLNVQSTKLNGAKCLNKISGSKLRLISFVPMHKGTAFEATVAYAGRPEQDQSQALPTGMKAGWIHYKSGSAAVCEPDLAHTWFPCNDHPLDKATFSFDVTVPPGYSAIANGIGTHTGQRFHFDLDRPTPTCMATIVVGKFDSIPMDGPNGISMNSYVPSGSKVEMKPQLAGLPGYVLFLTNLLGPYPYKSYGVIALPQEAANASSLLGASALETTSIPIFGPGTTSSRSILIHELAHQWLGNCVSATSWGDDIWWIEGFAQYSEWLLSEHEHGKDAYEQEAQSTYQSFASAGRWLKPGHLSAQEMFTERSYVGGALTFYALRKTIGDDAFFKSIRRFISEHRYRNGTTSDWIHATSIETGRDMKPFFTAWLYSDKVPSLPKTN